MQILNAYTHESNLIKSCVFALHKRNLKKEYQTQFETILIVAYLLLKQFLKNCMLMVGLNE